LSGGLGLFRATLVVEEYDRIDWLWDNEVNIAIENAKMLENSQSNKGWNKELISGECLMLFYVTL
jgi:hypothetical protein